MAKDRTDIDTPEEPVTPTTTKKLHVLKNGTQYDIDLYGDTADITDSYPNNKYGKIKVDGDQFYFPISTTLKDVVGGDTPLRIKYNGTTYQVNQHSDQIVSVNNPYNITVNVSLTYPDGKTGSISNGVSLTVPHGTSFKASYSVPADYNDGGINVSSGNVNRKTNIKVGDAKVIEYSHWVHDNTSGYFDIPSWVRVLKIKPDRWDAYYIPFYMNQASTTRVYYNLDNYKSIKFESQDKDWGDFINDTSKAPYAWGIRVRNDNDSVTIYWSREINKVPKENWRGHVGTSGGGKNSKPYPFGWNFD